MASTEMISVFIGRVHTLSSVVVESRRLWMTMVHVRTISGATGVRHFDLS